jgi:hypothetical protein
MASAPYPLAAWSATATLSTSFRTAASADADCGNVEFLARRVL